MRNSLIKKITTFALVFAVTLTTLPMLGGGISVEAKSSNKITVSAQATGYTTVSLSWTKINKPGKGYAVFRDENCIAHVGKSRSFGDSGLAPGSYHTYKVKAYTTKVKKTKKWYNKATGQYQFKKPAKKDRGKSKNFKTTTYKYSKASSPVGVSTPAMPAPQQASQPTITSPTNFQGSVSGSKITLTWNNVAGNEGYMIASSPGGSIICNKDKTSYTTSDLADGTYKFQIATIKGNKTSAWSNTVTLTIGSDGEKTVTDFQGVTRTLANPTAREDRTIDGTFIIGDIVYTQFDGTTIRQPVKYSWGCEARVYNGNAQQFTFTVNSAVQTYTNWSPEKSNPTSSTGTYINGTHGRRMAINIGEIRTASAASFIYDTTGYDSGTFSVTVKYDSITIDTVTFTITGNSNGLSERAASLYEIGCNAVAFYEQGGSLNELSSETYQTIKSSAGTYIAEMRAIEAYVRENYTYDQCDCWEGASILQTYSSVKHGEYGSDCYSNPNNTSHRAFRPDSYCNNGIYNVYFQTQGH